MNRLKNEVAIITGGLVDLTDLFFHLIPNM